MVGKIIGYFFVMKNVNSVELEMDVVCVVVEFVLVFDSFGVSSIVVVYVFDKCDKIYNKVD